MQNALNRLQTNIFQVRLLYTLKKGKLCTFENLLKILV